MSKFAVNLADVFMDPVFCLLLRPVCQSRQVITVDASRVDSTALALECEDARAKAIMHLSQIAPHRLRIVRWYAQEHAGGAWTPISHRRRQPAAITEEPPEEVSP